MELKLVRYASNAESTLGRLYINNSYQCYTVEDAHRDQKVDGKTRIPAGVYKVYLRELGTSHFDKKYLAQFGENWYFGMLQLESVPGFEGVEIHIGNSAKDTDGCILVGEEAYVVPDSLGSYTIAHSTLAFEQLYPIVRGALQQGEVVHITVKDELVALTS